MASYGPRLPERLVDAPSQRLYILSLALALQALKLLSFFSSLIEGPSLKLFFKWTFYDVLFLLLLRFMRIPRLTFRWKSSMLQAVMLVMLNWLLFGTYKIGFSSANLVPAMLYDVWMRLRGDYVGMDGYKVSITDLFRGDKHLLGQHTVKLTPISTAKLNPYLEAFCIPENVGHTFVPILFNNSEPSYITYSSAGLHDPNIRSTHNLRKKEILTRLDTHQLVDTGSSDEASSKVLSEDEAFDIEFGEYDDPRLKQSHLSQQKTAMDKYPPLQKTQRIRWIKISKPGTIKLETVQDGKMDVKLRDASVTIVKCPTARFTGPEEEKIRCRGDKDKLYMETFGVPPLKLEWQHDLGGKREVTTVESLNPDPEERAHNIYPSKQITIPLALDLDTLGQHIYSLNSITDGIGNKVELFSVGNRHKPEYTRSIAVLKPAEFAFQGCRAGETVNLLHGHDTSLTINAGYHDERDGPWKLMVQYTPEAAKAKGWTRELISPERRHKFKVEGPGEYRLLGARGNICNGDILSPEVCRVVEVPQPKVEIEWKKLHECSGDVGVTANLVLHGTPPFRIYYTTSHNKGPETTNSTVIDGSRGEITLQPERSGSYVYNFVSLSDKNYKNIPLSGQVISQTVHPLASAMFSGTSGRGSGRETTVQSCSGDVVEVPVELKGTAPWNLELQVVGPSGTETIQETGIKTDQHSIKIKLPKDIDRDGGTLLVDLISVEDANGCKRTLAVPGVPVKVRRVKPTVKFYAKDGARSVQVLYGEQAHLPLRLTGDGPWVVSWRYNSRAERVRRQRFTSANDVLSVTEAGVYELLEVRDEQCPGTVIVPEHTYIVEHVPVPHVRLALESDGTQARNGSWIRPPVCVSKEDFIDLRLKGGPPFQVMYSATRNKERPENHQFSSIQEIYRLPLQTGKSGRISYDIVAIGDSRYPLDERKALRESQILKWEQQVLARPTAYFKTDTQLSYCLNDAFLPRSEFELSQDGLMILEGKAPFFVDFSIQNMASSEVRNETMKITSHEWQVKFPDYVFTTVGSYIVNINSVRDSSSCEEIVNETGRRQLWVEVAETAMIVPYERRSDVCVGDLLQFQLEGVQPWTITYRFNDKVQKTIQKTPKYTTVANAPGEFSVVSIAHQQAQCQTTISDVRLTVHDIPSARVHHGTRFEESIREGEQAEIVFTLIGEPPFTFTYQRTELAQYARGRKPKVLETHTVAGITSKEHSIFSSAEGTWTVTFIADKWCRYPPAKTDPTIESI
ncbi:hypothetical protein FRB91_010951 [Serendipita sp. 411]|nr:hypothetical protein FRB91_010951 [Serendipita sp. 411]